jgi:lipoprotein-anchoring transpeptidase ErfK/SrfK
MTHSRSHPRASGLCRGLSASGLTVVALAAGGAIAVPARAAPASESLVVLLRDHVARSAPGDRAERIALVDGRRPLTGVRTVLPMLGRARSETGHVWTRVALPGRPNSSTGWIKAARTRRTWTSWRIAVKLDSRRVVVFHQGRAVRRFLAVVGASQTPTPRGRFFVEEAMALGSQAAGGPFALATSARSNVLQEFEGGPGQVALHGRNYLSEPLGTAASHGCIRLSTRAITWLSQRIGAGVPLTIAR